MTFATAAARLSSSPTTWARCSASATARCSWSAAGPFTSANRTRSPTGTSSSTSVASSEAAAASGDGHTGDGQARVLEVWVEGPDGAHLSSVPQHERVTLKARVAFAVEVTDPAAGVEVYNDEHRAVLVATTEIENERSGHFRAGEEVVVSFGFDNVLAPGRYSPVFQVTHRGSGLDVIDRFEGSFSFVVTGPAARGGLVDLPVQSGISRVPRRSPSGRAGDRRGATDDGPAAERHRGALRGAGTPDQRAGCAVG